MQWVAGAQRPANALLFAELGQHPFHVHWASLVLGFWNRLVSQPCTVAHKVFRDDIRLALLYKRGWAHAVLRFLRQVGHDPARDLPVADAVSVLANTQLQVGQLLEAMCTQLYAAWAEANVCGPGVDPIAYHGGHPKHCRYAQHMGVPARAGRTLTPPAHTKACIPHKQHVALMRLRLLACDFAVNRATNLPRAHRCCPLCACDGLAAVEDEKHVLVDCPWYCDLRARFLPKLSFGTMHALMQSADQVALAEFVSTVLERRSRWRLGLPALAGMRRSDMHTTVAGILLFLTAEQQASALGLLARMGSGSQ